MQAKLLPAEELLRTALRNGDACLLKSQQRIRASVLRSMILQLGHPHFSPGTEKVECNRWLISGAIFDGRIDLGDGRLPGGAPLPALEFIDCTFNGGFKANACHIERLTFERCSFEASPSPSHSSLHALARNPTTPISLRHATIISEFRLIDITPQAESTLWVDATGLKASSVTLRNVRLRAPQNECVNEDGYVHMALDLVGADITGDFFLTPNVCLEGGLRLRSARIGGDIWARGIHLTDGETDDTRPTSANGRDALSAQAARIRGNFMINTYGSDESRLVSIIGSAWMRGIEVDGNLDMSAVNIDQRFTLTLTEAKLGAFRMRPLELPTSSIRPRVLGGIHLDSASIRGHLTIIGNISDIDLDSARIDGDVYLSGDVTGFSGCRLHVGGDITLTGTYGMDYSKAEVMLRDADVGGQIDLSALRFAPNSISKKLDMRGAVIGRALLASNFAPLFSEARVVETHFNSDIVVIEVFVTANPDTNLNSVEWTTAEGIYATASVVFLSNRKTGQVVLVDGTPNTIRSIFDKLDLNSPEGVKDYLRLYCACTWTGLGAIAIVEKKSDLPAPLQGRVEIKPLDYKLVIPNKKDELLFVNINAHFRIGGSIYLGECSIYDNGDVEFAEPNTKKIFDGDNLISESRRYTSPYRYGRSVMETDYAPLNDGAQLDLEGLERDVPMWRSLLAPADRFSNTVIDLRDASCNTLRDAGGLAWENALLRLENFTYKRVTMTTNEVTLRSVWLCQRPHEDPFTPQPFAQLALVLREQGDEDAARLVEGQKVREQLSRRKDFVWRIWGRFYGKFFGYGLSVSRATITVLSCWLFGTTVVWLANDSKEMILSTTTVSTQAMSTNQGEFTSTIPVASGHLISDLPCGSNINPFLYAVETFTPLLNLHQEARCDIRQLTATEHWFAVPRWLELCKFIYELMGYVITSLAVLTFSGIARRWDQD